MGEPARGRGAWLQHQHFAEAGLAEISNRLSGLAYEESRREARRKGEGGFAASQYCVLKLVIFISFLNPGATNPKPGVFVHRASGQFRVSSIPKESDLRIGSRPEDGTGDV